MTFRDGPEPFDLVEITVGVDERGPVVRRAVLEASGAGGVTRKATDHELGRLTRAAVSFLTAPLEVDADGALVIGPHGYPVLAGPRPDRAHRPTPEAVRAALTRASWPNRRNTVDYQRVLDLHERGGYALLMQETKVDYNTARQQLHRAKKWRKKQTG